MKIAVVGSGTSGLGATWLLNEHSKHEVHLFEADPRPGGHANTVRYKNPLGDDYINVDTGFIVFNTVTYPNFLAFLLETGVPYLSSDMSFSVSRDRGLFEWAGASPAALFAQPLNLLNPSHWRMVWDILRFNVGALEVLQRGDRGDRGESIGDYLARERYSQTFIDNYLLPMTAAIWSTPPDKAALDFPALTLIRFMHNHHLMQILDRPTWLTVENGSHSYVNRILNRLDPAKYHQGRRIESVRTGGKEGKVVLKDSEGNETDWDHVIFACHADTTLKILEKGEGITEEEKRILSGFEFSKNRAVLHSDPELMPQRRIAWSAWNYLTASDGPKLNVNSVALTYWMNLLQSIPEAIYGPVLVTLNPPFEPRKEHKFAEWDYEHPLFSEKSVRSQDELKKIQNKRGITFAGAWTKYGFHEDGLTSGLRIAVDHLGAQSPFPIRHAERNLNLSRTDRCLNYAFSRIDSLARIFSFPATVFLLVLIIGLSVTRMVITVLGARSTAAMIGEVIMMLQRSNGASTAPVVKLDGLKRAGQAGATRQVK
ncbi:BZ3500_MvSof-1268-A1-R1_Chr3-2g06281 [Microbotryum saponariae]|uniref:BZ3500_MvSof-1268-A1-R1_Chr3-2g06281 protein n=1 Tax=Microbotryum saponariae TaxID=289078 RepID=A0A2X0LHA4_9BASI|nr:BZ3500_MvSof-1268-A1-R1_Chr3-2g06281 [Microbotryum saponariae]SDA04252.1 BZ3501_MvSof-1269-A2-R1_Chr3-2g05972 [Microbotryum saponariae]